MSDTLESGYYMIRYVPEGASPPFIGGVYATDTGLNKIIKLEDLFTPGVDPRDRVWRVQQIEDNTNSYRITLGTITREAPHGFALPIDNIEDSDGVPVIDSLDPAVWEINKGDTDHVWSIILPWETVIVGATRALFNKEGILGVKGFPVVPGVKLPTWAFDPIPLDSN